jgi:multicomponent Na+:H+ antiporter subunit G
MIGFALILAGSVISVIGALGLLRFPDIYTRSHAQTVVNVGGTCLILIGVSLGNFLSLYSVKSLLLIIFIFLTSPVGTHAIARAAYKSGVKPRKLEEDQLGYKIAGIEKPQPKGNGHEKPRQLKYKFRTKRFFRRRQKALIKIGA